MYSTKTAITMSLKDILDKLTDLDIYTYCIGQFRVGKLMNSPLRSDDNNPSFGIFQARNGGLLYVFVLADKLGFILRTIRNNSRSSSSLVVIPLYSFRNLIAFP